MMATNTKYGEWTRLAATFRKSFEYLGDKQKIQWFPGHMLKGLRQMQRALLETDCVIEVHDARIPMSGRNVNFKHSVIGNRPHVLVLNKRDLVLGSRPEQDRRKSKSTKRSGLLVATQHEADLIHKIKEQNPTVSDVIFTNCKDIHCPGLKSVLPKAIELVQESDRFHRSNAPDANILVVGVPNVGKSSLINLIRSKTLKIGGNHRFTDVLYIFMFRFDLQEDHLLLGTSLE